MRALTDLAHFLHMAYVGGPRVVLHYLSRRLRGRGTMTLRTQGMAFPIPAVAWAYPYTLDALGKLRNLVDAVESDDVKIVFDVGANHGHFAALALARWPQARVFAFEPAKDMADRIHAALGNRVTLVRAAVTDREGESAFFINEHSQATNSLLRDAVARFSRDGKLQQCAVATTTLDAFCAQHDIAHIDVLKVDIQGGESALLRGARHMIAHTGCALVEVSLLDPDPVYVMQTLDVAFARRRVIELVQSGGDVAYDRPRR